MARIFIFMFCSVGIALLVIIGLAISEKMQSHKENVRKKYKKLQEDYGKVVLQLAKNDETFKALDKAAQAEYAVNTSNVFAASVSDTIQSRAGKKKARSLT